MLINFTDSIAPADFSRETSLFESFNIALTGCTVTFSALDIELNKVANFSKDDPQIGARQKAKFVWNEQFLQDLMVELRGQREALNLLVTIVQRSVNSESETIEVQTNMRLDSHSIGEIKDLLKNSTDVFKNVKHRTGSLHRPTNNKHNGNDHWDSETFSIFTEHSEKERFDFDSDILKSTVYKRVYSSVRKARSPRHPRAGSSEFLTINPTDENSIELRDHTPLVFSHRIEIERDVSSLAGDQRYSLRTEQLSSPSPGKATFSVITRDNCTTSSAAHLSQDCNIHPAYRRDARYKTLRRPPSADHVSQDVATRMSVEHSHRMIARSATYDVANRPVSKSEGAVEVRAGSAEKDVRKEAIKPNTRKLPTASRNTISPYIFELMSLPKSPSSFTRAAGSGRLEDVRHRLMRANHLDRTTLEEALLLASLHGHKDIVGLLLIRGPNINCTLPAEVVIRDKSHKYLTPLHLAAAGDSSPTIKLLLENGAEISPKDSLEWTPLHLAAARGCVSAVRTLIEYHAPIEAKAALFIEATDPNRMNRTISRLNQAKSILDHVSWTPLFVAAHFGALKTAHALLEKGADAHEEPASGFTLLHSATLVDSRYGFHGLNETSIGTWPQGNIRHIRLLSKCPPQSLNHAVLVEYLIVRGLHPFSPDAFGYTPLHLACLYSFDIACVLIKHTTSISTKSEFGWTPLHIAALWSSDTQLAQLLIEAGADLEIPLIPQRPPVLLSGQQAFCDPYTTCLTPLGLAVAKGNYNMVVQFLKMGARTQMPDLAGTNIVHIAAAMGDTSMLILLATQGIDFSKTRRQGMRMVLAEIPTAERSPTWRTSFKRNSQNDRKGQPAVDFTTQSRQKFFASEECLPKSLRIDVDTRDCHGYTPLLRLINEVNDVTVRIPAVARLLDLGADATVFDHDRLHLLHFSAKLETDEIRQLVTAGADLEAKDRWCQTPLHRLVRFGHYPAKVELLIALGANIYAKDRHSRSVWDHLSDRPKSRGAHLPRSLFSSPSRSDLTEDNYRSEVRKLLNKARQTKPQSWEWVE
ncbi:MAG: hypothetical protein Q9160_000953 [Pyrenula sp. 1 TL-2023]